MGNPIYNAFRSQSSAPSPFGNITNMIKQFNQFRAGFQGDPQSMVQQLINSGKMSQEQFEQLSNVAKQFQGMLGGGA